MRRTTAAPTILLTLSLSSACAVAPKVDPIAEMHAIRAQDSRFSAAAARLDVVGAAALYAPDATILPPGLPAVHGADAIRTMLAGLFTAPGLSITLRPQRIDVAAAGDLATDQGEVEVGMNTAECPVIEVSKYLEVWRKVDGEWKLMYDTWNANAPAVPAPAEAKKR
ncbi:MAG TPA: nuclear transport factor 2 family protein [Gemmatimonadales bacterium]|nr:nuclear transport factor 2 family protein [Gemmatimonadales bacterium]